MGNHYSSSCFQILSKPPQHSTLFDLKGNLLRKLDLPSKAAEVMLEEEPGHVIAPAEEVRRVGRFTAMKAEEELLAKKVYLIVPFGWVNRKVSASEMALIDVLVAGTGKKRSSRSKVLPAGNEEETREGEEEKVVVPVFGKIDTGFLGQQLTLRGNCRGWKPVLEVINE